VYDFLLSVRSSALFASGGLDLVHALGSVVRGVPPAYCAEILGPERVLHVCVAALHALLKGSYSSLRTLCEAPYVNACTPFSPATCCRSGSGFQWCKARPCKS